MVTNLEQLELIRRLLNIAIHIVHQMGHYICITNDISTKGVSASNTSNILTQLTAYLTRCSNAQQNNAYCELT